MTLQEFLGEFGTEEAARELFERCRWPDGPVCPRCGVIERASRLASRPSQLTCLECRHRFSVTSGTPLHGSKLPLQTWLVAMYLIASSSKGMSALKLASWLGVTYKTAWYMGHRIRAMMEGDPGLLCGLVEVDETYVGGKPRKVHREKKLAKDERPQRLRGRATAKGCVFVAVERGGQAVARVVAGHTKGSLGEAVRASLDRTSVLLSDELPAYTAVGRGQAEHLRVRHSDDEFARTCQASGIRIHVNTAESLGAMLKRAIVGVFHFVSKKHLKRYAAEASFRWNARELGPMERLRRMIRFLGPSLPYGRLVA